MAKAQIEITLAQVKERLTVEACYPMPETPTLNTGNAKGFTDGVHYI